MGIQPIGLTVKYITLPNFKYFPVADLRGNPRVPAPHLNVVVYVNTPPPHFIRVYVCGGGGGGEENVCVW